MLGKIALGNVPILFDNAVRSVWFAFRSSDVLSAYSVNFSSKNPLDTIDAFAVPVPTIPNIVQNMPAVKSLFIFVAPLVPCVKLKKPQ